MGTLPALRIAALRPFLIVLLVLAAVVPATASCPLSNSVRKCGGAFVAHDEPAYFEHVQCGVIGGDCLLPGETVAYDIPRGLVQVSVATSYCPDHPAVTSRDRYWIVGPASADPIQCTAQLDLTGHGAGCSASGGVTFTVNNVPVSASFQIVPVAPNTCGPNPSLPPTLSQPISQPVGAPFDLVIAVDANTGSVGTSADVTAQLSFKGLPPGYSVVSCNGYGMTGPTPAARVSWGSVKDTYR